MDAAVTSAQTEYEQRRAFVEIMKSMSKPEFIEVARILKKHNVTMSENRSGIYFDMTQLSSAAFTELQQFHKFVLLNNRELEGQEAEKRKLISSS